jgi:hypothetical protein
VLSVGHVTTGRAQLKPRYRRPRPNAEWLSVKEASELWGVGEATIRRDLDNLDHMRIGGTIRLNKNQPRKQPTGPHPVRRGRPALQGA